MFVIVLVNFSLPSVMNKQCFRIIRKIFGTFVFKNFGIHLQFVSLYCFVVYQPELSRIPVSFFHYLVCSQCFPGAVANATSTFELPAGIQPLFTSLSYSVLNLFDYIMFGPGVQYLCMFNKYLSRDSNDNRIPSIYVVIQSLFLT